MIGLGKMGGNMATRLVQKGISVVGFDRSAEVVKTLEEKAKIIGANSVADAVAKLDGQKIVWLMVPAGNPTEEQIKELMPSSIKATLLLTVAIQITKTLSASVNSLKKKVLVLWIAVHQVVYGV